METILAQFLFDTGVSSNWLITGLLGILVFLIQRSNAKADQREKKVDQILEKQGEQLDRLTNMVSLHDYQIKEMNADVEMNNSKLADIIITKLRAAGGG